MDDRHDNQARFYAHTSTPLTAMRGAIDLLRHPNRTADDPVSRELIDTLERSSRGCAKVSTRCWPIARSGAIWSR
jgi:hypothetical protein